MNAQYHAIPTTTPPPDPPRTRHVVHIEHIPANCNPDVFYGLLGRIGRVVNTPQIVDGCCDVEFADLEAALECCKLDQRKIKNCDARLSVALV